MAEHTFVIGFDPGPHTGVAVVRREDGALSLGVVVTERDGPAVWNTFLRPRLAYQVTHWVCEKFTLYEAQSKEATQTIRTEGVLEFIARMNGIPIVFQPPSYREGYLKLVVLREPMESKHIKDAYAHALAFLRSKPTKEEVEQLRAS